jgi:hypothetical protein
MTITYSTVLAGLVYDRLKGCRITGTVVECHGMKVGMCRACESNDRHPACVVVITKLNDEWTDPITRLDGYSTPCCWKSISNHMREQEREHIESFEGFTIEVPAA